MTEYKDYNALVHDINLADITSSMHNADILRQLLDDDPDWNKSLYILENEIDGEDNDEFIVGAGDDLGWLGYFIGRSEVIEVLEVQYLPEEREQVDAFMWGIIQNQSIKRLSIKTDIGDQGFENLGRFLRNNNALASLRFVNFHVGRECAHDVAMALEQCRHDSLRSFDLESSNDEDTFSEIAEALRFQSQLDRLHFDCNNIGRDGCVALANTLRRWQSSNLQCLTLSNNNIDDLGLEALVEGMTNCSNLETVHLCDNRSITAAGIRSISPLLQSETCSLKFIMLQRINFGDEGAIALADGLRGNKSLSRLVFAPISAGVTDVGWSAFSKLLCDTSSINNTYLSNHTLEWVGSLFYDDSDTPPDVRRYLLWNKDQRIDAAICKILTTHDHFDMKPFFRWKLKFLPVMVAWFQRAREAGLAGLNHSLGSKKLSSMYDFVRGMPMLVVGGNQGQEKTRRRSRKRRLNGEAK
eukprot:scaffold1562_cov93-Skeletonema_dohrnii-CCMP3373.AAC.11